MTNFEHRKTSQFNDFYFFLFLCVSDLVILFGLHALGRVFKIKTCLNFFNLPWFICQPSHQQKISHNVYYNILHVITNILIYCMTTLLQTLNVCTFTKTIQIRIYTKWFSLSSSLQQGQTKLVIGLVLSDKHCIR